MVWPTEYDVKLDEFDAFELPGQQLPAAQAPTSLDHLLSLDIKAPPACQRLTCIIATIGKNSDQETIEKMIGAGMNVALINMAHGSRDDQLEVIKTLRQAAKEYSIKMGRMYPLAIAAALSGRKIRTGKIADTYGETVELKPGEMVRITSDETYRERCSSSTIFVDFIHFAEEIKRGDIVLIDAETIMLKVDVISATTITCKIERGGYLGSYKDVFIPNALFNMPNYTEKDKQDIEMIVKEQVDIVIAPFVHGASFINELKTLLGEKGKKISIIAKIQSLEGFKKFDEILQIANGIMLSRQELGSDITPKKLVIAQKNMIARANQANVPICISAQLLSSMRYKSLPLRAELLDVSNCILDGADGLVASAETAIGPYAVETVACLASACKEAEACVWSRQIYEDLVEKTPVPCEQATCACLAAVLAAYKSMAACIIVVTTTGKTAHIVAKFRPRCPILAVTRHSVVARQAHMWRGIIPLVYEAFPDADWLVDVENRVNFCSQWGLEQGFIRVGDPLVVVSGWRQGPGFTNTTRVVYAAVDHTPIF